MLNPIPYMTFVDTVDSKYGNWIDSSSQKNPLRNGFRIKAIDIACQVHELYLQLIFNEINSNTSKIKTRFPVRKAHIKEYSKLITYLGSQVTLYLLNKKFTRHFQTITKQQISPTPKQLIWNTYQKRDYKTLGKFPVSPLLMKITIPFLNSLIRLATAFFGTYLFKFIYIRDINLRFSRI